MQLPRVRRTLRRGAAPAALVACATLGLSCGGDGGPSAPPEPGPVTVSLTTPRTDDGALVLSLAGPGLTAGAVSSASPSYVVHARASSGEVRVFVMGDITSGPLLRVTVPDPRAAASFQVTILDAADRANAAVPLAGRTFTVAR